MYTNILAYTRNNIHIYKYAYIHNNIYTHMLAYTRNNIHTYKHEYIHNNIHTHAYKEYTLHTYTHTCINYTLHTYIFAYINNNIHTYKHKIYIIMYIHTHTHILLMHFSQYLLFIVIVKTPTQLQRNPTSMPTVVGFDMSHR